MPCRNAAATLNQAVESILNQSFRDIELLVWNDGSIDESPKLLEDFAAGDARVRIVGDVRVGLIEALSCLAARSSSPLLARMDADDISLPRRFTAQIDYLDARPDIALCGCCHETIGDTGGSGRARYDAWINSLLEPEDIRRELFVECPIAHPTFMMRRAAFEAVGGYRDCPWPEDYDLIIRLAEQRFELGKVGETLFQWRNHAARTSLNDPRYGEIAFRALKRHYLKRTHGHRLNKMFQWGAGDVGKRWLQEWREIRPNAVVDIHPRKVGTRIHGYDIIAPEQLPSPGEAFVVVTVGARGARDDIRSRLNPKGWREGEDYLFLA